MAVTTGHSINTGPYGENTEIYSSLKLLHWLNLNKNQRLSRACIVHLVIKKNNWSYVKTMSCSGSHLGITINIKNTEFVKDLPMIDAQFRFNQCNSFREEYIPGERYRLLRASGFFSWKRISCNLFTTIHDNNCKPTLSPNVGNLCWFNMYIKDNLWPKEMQFVIH
jgi:hypothetical protein